MRDWSLIVLVVVVAACVILIAFTG